MMRSLSSKLQGNLIMTVSTRKGIPFVVAAVFLMSLQDALFKFVSGDIVLWQVFAFRGAVATLILLIFIPLMGGSGSTWVAAFRPWVLLRSTLFALMFVSFYAAIATVDLAVVAAGYYTSPIFIALLSAAMTADRIKPLGWCAVVLGFIGVVIILRPVSVDFNPMTILPIFSALCYAFAAIIVRIKCQNENPISLVVSLNVVLMTTGILATLALLVISPSSSTVSGVPFLLGGWLWFDRTSWGIIVALAFLMIVSAYLLVKAYQITAPSIVATFDYSYLIFSIMWGFLIFAETPDAFTIIGMVCIAGAGLISARA